MLEYLAYETTPIERKKRAEIIMEDARKTMTPPQMEFLEFIMQMYVNNGYHELGMDKLAQLIDMKYHSITDGMIHLNMNPTELRDFFLNMQKELYHGKSVLNFKIENNIYGNIDNFNEYK